MRLMEYRLWQEVKCDTLRRQHEVALSVAPQHENKDQRMFTSAIIVQDSLGSAEPLSMAS